MDDVLRVEDRYYILSTSSLADDRVRVLKHGETFAVFDRRGDIEPLGMGVQGLYHEETRHLSRWVLRLEKVRPMLLSSGIKDDNASLAVDLTNPDLYVDGQNILPRGALHIARSKFLWEGTHYEQLQLVNYGMTSVETSFSIQFGCDFADIFEVRGMRREHRGERLADSVDHDQALLSYRGLDGVIRRTRVRCAPKPRRISNSEILLDVCLQPKAQQTYLLTVSCESPQHQSRPSVYVIAASQAALALHRAQQQEARNLHCQRAVQ